MSSSLYLLFRVSTHLCAFPTIGLKIYPLPALAQIEQMPHLLSGLVNLAGQFLPVIELSRLLELPESPSHIDQHLLHFQFQNWMYRVDQALELVNLAELTDLPSDLTLNNVVDACWNHQGENVWLLNPQHLLLAEEQRRLTELKIRAQIRLQAWKNN